MMISSLKGWLKDISISKKLYFTIGIMAFLVIIELTTLWFSISTLSAVRASVAGEGLWSKAQKDAVFHLRTYGYSHNEADYSAFKTFLEVPTGDRNARAELKKSNPDMEVVRLGFTQGRNHPDDIDGMTNLITRFQNISYIKKALSVWDEAEHHLKVLVPIGARLHQMISSNAASQQDIDKVLQEVVTINEKLTLLEDNFSSTLGEGSRWLENLILKLLFFLAITVETIGILITISISRSIEKGLKEILKGAELIKEGNLNTRVKVYSRDEIGQLSAAFNQMTGTLENNIQDLKTIEENLKTEKIRAETSEKVKQIFMANMSHEIRTPMNAILGFARLLEESPLTKEQQEYMQAIIKSGDDLLVILNDILDFSRIEEGKMMFESIPFSLEDTIKSTVLMMQPKSRLKNIILTHHIDETIPGIIIGDSVRLNQILFNLVSNAVKFTEQGTITVSVYCTNETNEDITLEFVIKDTGIGIPLEKQSIIFESFEQAAGGAARKFGGTGLGLSIVKQLVERQNGEITVNSIPGHGSEFHFKLSFKKSDMVHQGDKQLFKYTIGPELFPESEKLIRILVVEDNPVNQLLAARVLHKCGFEADIAENGKIALDKYSNNNYDIILMDLQMPEMDGYEATIRIRSMNNSKRNIPIIAMTAHTIKGEFERCMTIGMNDYISKPFHTNDLCQKIYTYVPKNVNNQVTIED
jgi:signal transduction histidine kinase/CheY-like chemotaxis protein